MKKILVILYFTTCLSSYAQSKKKLSKWLDDYAICNCLSQYYSYNNIKTNDGSSGYWLESSLIDVEVLMKVGRTIEVYVKKIIPNSGYDGRTPIINNCLMVREDEGYLKIKKEILNGTIKTDL